MKRIISKIIILAVFVAGFACTDDALDPFRLKELEKGSLLALRGDDGTAGNLDPDQNFFLKDNVTGNETFSYVADFVSEDQSLLESVQVYARLGTGGARSLVATIPGSSFVATGSAPRQGTVSVTLAQILTAMGNNKADTLSRTNLLIESDIVLTNGTIVPSSAIVNTGLFAAAAFFPAHQLNYYAEVSSDFQPVATTKLAGEVVKNAAGAVTSRPVFPLKSGSRDTLLITFPRAVSGPPTVVYSPASALTTITPVTLLPNKKSTDVTQTFFQVVEATASNSGAVTATITGSQWDVLGVTLTMKSKTQTVNVDNTIPQLTSLSTGRRIGKGQIVTIKAVFNEKMSNKTADRLKVTISGQGQEGVSAQNMTLSTNGLELTYTFLFKEATAGSATHGPLTVTFTGGADEAGNAIPVGTLNTAASAPSVQLVSDIGAPPAPALVLDPGGHDLGTQIKWSADQGTAVTNVDGSVTGRVYWIARTTGSSAPTAFALDADENGVWTIGTGTTATTSVQAFSASISVAETAPGVGQSGTVFSPLTTNGTLDIYAVFVGNTGNKSAIPAVPQLVGVVMAP